MCLIIRKIFSYFKVEDQLFDLFLCETLYPNCRSDKTLHTISIDKVDRSFYCNSLLRIINAVKRARDLLRLLISLILHVYDSNFTLKQVLCLKT